MSGKSKKRDGFTFYRSFYEASRTLSKPNRLVFYDALVQHSLDFDVKVDDLPPKVRSLFLLVEPVIAKSFKGYLAKVVPKVIPKHLANNEYDYDYNNDYNNEEKDANASLPAESKALNSCYTYMDIKNYLEANASKLIEDFEFVLEDRLIKVSPKGKLYDVKQVDDLIKIDFELETRALKYLLNNKGMIK